MTKLKMHARSHAHTLALHARTHTSTTNIKVQIKAWSTNLKTFLLQYKPLSCYHQPLKMQSRISVTALHNLIIPHSLWTAWSHRQALRYLENRPVFRKTHTYT